MKQVNSDLENYICDKITLQYLEFDKGHNIDHVNDVIKNSLEIAQAYCVDLDMVFVIAAYHDVGMKHGRKNHHIMSAQIMTNDEFLKKIFTTQQITIMAEAIEDHRASNDYEPRTIYGKIISEADRVIDAETVLYRTMQYGKSNFPQLSDEEQFERTFRHIAEKYGENGYLKLWLNTDRNEKGLNHIRELLKDKAAMRALCDSLTL